MATIIVNFSGHPLCSETKEFLHRKYDKIIDAPAFNLNFDEEIEPQFQVLISNLEYPIDGSEPLTIIPPGQSTFSILLVSFIHGLIGHFPKICYLELTENGFYYPKVEYDINLQQLRAYGRKFRQDILKA